ncbi:hypothetical protein [Heliorestis convoluta]|uniref:hypothetical protein n=1 Tax=Heliorestis convoluta TaxID=356322 RepID=UPI00129BEB79|nr:hypothetical protein [Heliorestis convoluta]
MEGKMLLKGLIRLKGEDLRLLYTLFNEVTVWTALRNRMFDKISFVAKTEDESHHFESLKEKAGEFVVESDEELQLRLLLEMARTLQISKVNCASEEDLLELTDYMADGVLQLLHEQEEDFTGHSMEKMALWQLQKLSQACKNCDNGATESEKEGSAKVAAAATLDALSEAFTKALSKLSAETASKEGASKEPILFEDRKEEAPVDGVDGVAAATATAATTATAQALPSYRPDEGAEFADHQEASVVDALEAPSKEAHLDRGDRDYIEPMPAAVVTAPPSLPAIIEAREEESLMDIDLKEALSVIAKPSFLLKLFGGSTSWLSFSQGNLFRQRLLPLLITMIVLPEIKNPSRGLFTELLVVRWNYLQGDHQKLLKTLQSLKTNIGQLVEQTELAKVELSNLKEKLAINQKKEEMTRASLLEKIRESQTYVRDGAIKESALFKGTVEEEPLHLLALQYLYKLGEAVVADQKASYEQPKFLQKLKNWQTGYSYKKDLANLEEQLIPALLQSTVAFAAEERAVIVECQGKQERLQLQIEESVAKIETILQSIKVEKKHQEKIEEELQALELRYYGLGGQA